MILQYQRLGTDVVLAYRPLSSVMNLLEILYPHKGSSKNYVMLIFVLLAVAEGTTARNILNKFNFRSLNRPFRVCFCKLKKELIGLCD